jgi:hypothetical protein
LINRLMGCKMSIEDSCRLVARELTACGFPVGGRREWPDWVTVRSWRRRLSQLPADDKELELVTALQSEDEEQPQSPDAMRRYARDRIRGIVAAMTS